MGVFHYPRINVNGLLLVNVGTANNYDYYDKFFLPGAPYAAGKPVMLADSPNVQPTPMDGTQKISDTEWLQWAITPLTISKVAPQGPVLNKGEGGNADADPNKVQIIPGEWNYFGDMGLTMQGVTVTGITDPGGIIPAPLKSSLINGALSFNNRPGGTVPNPPPGAGKTTGVITDVNPEDSNCSQMFADFLSLEANGAFLFSGKPTKGITRWINFQRNIYLGGANGAAGTFQMCVPLSELQGQPILQGLPPASPDGAPLKGIVFRYTLYRPLQQINVFKYKPTSVWIEQMTTLYATQGLNPDYIQLQGTIAPWFEGEPESCPVGRLLIPTEKCKTIPVPQDSIGNGPAFSLCPAVASIYTLKDPSKSTLSIDCSATFPDQYDKTYGYDPTQTKDNPKWDFGAITLKLYNGSSNEVVYSQSISYQDATTGNQQGWLFDFDIDLTNEGIKDALQNGFFAIESAQYGMLLQEIPYFILSDQSGLYAEQAASPAATFRNNGPDLVPTSFQVYKRGKLSNVETLTLYYYDTTPGPSNQGHTLQPLMPKYQAGQPISISVSQPGNRLITAVLYGDAPPPADYTDFKSTYCPLINIRILPNDQEKNFDQYYLPRQNPTDPLVGNDQLTFEVIYTEVLRNYYLLYPAMNQRIPLNDPDEWTSADMARRLKQHVSLSYWNTGMAMPRTRDLSQSRRDLITAWCNKFF